MAGLRIRWRRESTGLPAAPAERPATASGGVALGVFIWPAAIAIVLLALTARLYNVDWDANTHLHPDERFITFVAVDIELPSSVSEYFDTDRSRFNPYNREAGTFVYGTLPLFLTKAVAVAVDQDGYDSLTRTGRHLAGLFDAATVAAVFLLGRRLYGALAGLLAAVLYASAPLAIQHAHFLVVDPFVTFFFVAGLYSCVRVVQDGRPVDYVLAGLAIGLGTACKLTALSLLPVLGLAAALRLWPVFSTSISQRRNLAPESRAALMRTLQGLVLAIVLAFLAFRVAQPYAFETPGLSPISWVDLNDRFIRDQREQDRLLGGDVAFPPSVQWIDRASYLYPLQEMLRFGMGPAFGIAGWAGLVYAAFRLVRYREPRHLLLVAFVLIYFGFMGRQFSLYMRYYLPLYPVLAVLGGFALVDLVRWAKERAGRDASSLSLSLSRGTKVVAAATVALAVLIGLAYFSIYTRPVTRIEASYWMYDNLPARSTIAVEHWDETVPMGLPGSPDKQFEVQTLLLYELDTPEKVSRLIATLDSSRYVVVSSTRLLHSIPRNEVSYPVTSRYYELLFEERLGFHLVRKFTSYPGVLGLDLPDWKAEESWTSYDHPPVWLFEKGPDYSRSRLEELLGRGPFGRAHLTPAQADRNGLLLRRDDLATQRAGGTWTDVFSDSGLVRNYPTLLWLALVEAAALAATPLLFVLCRRLPDRGYLLAKPFGLFLLAYPVWLAASLKFVSFERETVLVWLALLLIAATALVRLRASDLLAFWRAKWRLVLISEAVFLVAFFFLRELRLENPDLWHLYRGGEKPMDLAYLTAVTRSTTLPPYDPWFAGGYINYYYLGQFFTATLLKATSIAPAVAFNLAIPTYFAFTVAAAFSVSFNLAAAARGFLRRGPGFRPIAAWSPYAAAVLGALFVALAGNLDGVGQLVDRLTAVSPWRVDAPLIGSVLNSIGGLWQVIVHGAALQPFDYWRSSRMLPPSISITEFPYFSFLFADLHAHVMAMPFQLLTLGIALSLVLGRRDERSSWQEWGLVALLGLLTGGLRWLNSWDYPPFLLFALTAVLISERRLESGVGAAFVRVAAKAALLTGLSFLLYEPFLAGYLAPTSGVHASPETTPVHQYLAHFGLFVAAIGLWLVYLAARVFRPARLRALVRDRHSANRPQTFSMQSRGIVIASLMVGGAVLSIEGHALVALLLPPLVLVAYLALRELRLMRRDGGLRLFVLAMAGLALGLSIGVDLVTINGDISRMNTVFKFYLHAWVLLALVAAFAVWSLVFVFWRPVVAKQARLADRLAPGVGKAALAALVLGALLYPVFATPARLNDRFVNLPRSLDGTAFMAATVYNDPKGPIDLAADYEGIKWLRENARGTPAIVEGRSELYRWGGRFSIYTGLPAVLGWDWHQRQQRGELASMVDQRAREVDAFYRDPGANQALLRQYGVQYVIVGQLERLYYPGPGLLQFGSLLGGALEVAYSNRGLTIYRVKPGPAFATFP